MIFFVAVLFLLIISGAEFSKPNEFNKDYISRAGTTAIKGIFVILIMFSHGKGYIDVGGKFDVPYLKMQDHLNQMIVAMFMFYSGYGIMESIKKKGSAYIDTIPKKRFPQVLLNMDIAVVLFLILAATAGKFYSVGHILLSLIGWESVGNSNWYIFVILALYVVTYFAFLILKKKNNKTTQLIGVIITTVLSVAFVYILMKTKTIVVVQHADSVFARYVVFVFQGQNRKGFDEKRFDFLRRVGCACFGLSRGVQYALGLWYLFIHSLGGAVHTRHRDDYDEGQNHKPCSRMVWQPCFQRLHSAKNTYDFAFTLRRSRQA